MLRNSGRVSHGGSEVIYQDQSPQVSRLEFPPPTPFSLIYEEFVQVLELMALSRIYDEGSLLEGRQGVYLIINNADMDEQEKKKKTAEALALFICYVARGPILYNPSLKAQLEAAQFQNKLKSILSLFCNEAEVGQVMTEQTQIAKEIMRNFSSECLAMHIRVLQEGDQQSTRLASQFTATLAGHFHQTQEDLVALNNKQIAAHNAIKEMSDVAVETVKKTSEKSVQQTERVMEIKEQIEAQSAEVKQLQIEGAALFTRS